MDKSLDEILDTTFDSRQLIERMEEIDGDTDPELQEEYAQISEILDEIGDEAAYGVSLIREDYFEDYARELAEDIGAIDADAAWPNNYIDWEAAANALQMDYTSIEIQGDTYYYR
jgi:antirestriction protein